VWVAKQFERLPVLANEAGKRVLAYFLEARVRMIVTGDLHLLTLADRYEGVDIATLTGSIKLF